MVEEHGPRERSLAEVGLAALVVTIAIVLVCGILQTLLFEEFPGITWFVMRIAVTFPFTVAWWMMAGNGRTSAIVGGVLLGLLLTTYSHYLGPVGLPSDPARLFAPDSPSAIVHWLSYRQEFMVVLPLTALVASIGYWLALKWHPDRRADRNANARTTLLAAAGATAAMVCLAVFTAPALGPDGDRASISSVGTATVGGSGGAVHSATAASLRMTVENRATHRTPLPPHDVVDLSATVPGAGGEVFDIRATRPMVADPSGRFTTWHGVSFGKWHGGRSGIGLSATPAVKPNVVAFALGDVRSNGRLVATGVPLQVTANAEGTKWLQLHVGDSGAPETPFQLEATWEDFAGGYSNESKHARYLFGSGLLLILLGFAFAGALSAARQWKSSTAEI